MTFERAIMPLLKKTANTFPVTLLTGPRQSGKTTLLKQILSNYHYVTLESPDILLRLQEDPRGFLEGFPHLIIDEAQNYPPLFSYIQEYVDHSKQTQKFVLSGSQNFLLAENISQTLAGRAAVLELLPLSYAEYMTYPKQKQPDLWDYLFHGSYPRPYHEKLDHELWYNSYIRTYLERDVRSLIHIRDLSRFQLFLKLCAGRHGQLLNLSSLSNECGISQTTASHWLNILEASYIVFRLQPYYRNFNKRLVKTPKLYFYDTSIVCRLLGIDSSEHLSIHASRGAIFEGFMLTEILKTYRAQGKNAPLYFFRDQTGDEVDIIIEKNDGLLAIETKSSKTFVPDLLNSLKRWQKISHQDAKNCWIIYGGKETLSHQEFSILSWRECLNFLKLLQL